MENKIAEILSTGGHRRHLFDKERNDAIKAFVGIYGVGKLVATKWFDKGLRTLDDIREGKFGHELTMSQRTGLMYYDDLQQRIPRAEVTAVYDLVKQAAVKIDKNLIIECMGSYRRGQDDCGDIDLLITRDTRDGIDHRGTSRFLYYPL